MGDQRAFALRVLGQGGQDLGPLLAALQHTLAGAAAGVEAADPL